MHTPVIRTYQLGHSNIAIRPVFNYTKAKCYFNQFEECKNTGANLQAYKNIDRALLNRPGYDEYLKEKAFLLQQTGYADEALILYRSLNSPGSIYSPGDYNQDADSHPVSNMQAAHTHPVSK
jgi:hypothetical protein